MESKNTLNLTVTLPLSKSPPVCSPTEQARTQQTLLEPLDRVRTTGGFSEPSHLFSKKLTISSEFLSLHWIRYIPVLWIQWNLDIINPQQSFARSDLSSVHVFSYMVIFFPNDLIQKPPQWMRKTPTNLTTLGQLGPIESHISIASLEVQQRPERELWAAAHAAPRQDIPADGADKGKACLKSNTWKISIK